MTLYNFVSYLAILRLLICIAITPDIESISAIVIGIIDKWDENFVWIKPIDFDLFSEGSLKDFCILHDEDGFISGHNFDPKVLKTYNLEDEVGAPL